MKPNNPLEVARLEDARPSLIDRVKATSRSARLIAILTLIVFSAVALISTSSATSIGAILRSGRFNSASSSKPNKLKPAPRDTKRKDSARSNQSGDEKIRAAGDLNVGRRGHTATTLADGRVLIIGGENENGPVNDAEIYDPVLRKFSLAAKSMVARSAHTAIRLADGRVLIIGGRGAGDALSSTEIFDPATGLFNDGPALNRARANHSATALADGRILIAGGDGEGTAEIFNAEAGVFTLLDARMNAARAGHSAVLLKSGKALIAGGALAEADGVQSAEIFYPETLSFHATANAMRAARTRPALRVLPDGKVQVIGGDKEGSMEMFNNEGEYFTAYARLLDAPATSSEILSVQMREALIRQANVRTEEALSKLSGAKGDLFDRRDYSLNEIPQANQTILVGGVNSAGMTLNSTLAMTTTTATLTTDKTDYAPGEIVTITGTGWKPSGSLLHFRSQLQCGSP